MFKYVRWTNCITQRFTEKHNYLSDKQHQCKKLVNDNSKCTYIKTPVKLQQSLYRSGQTLRVPGAWGSQISRQSVHDGVKAPATFTLQEILLVLIFVRSWVDSRAIVWPEGLCQWTITTPTEIELATFRLVAQHSYCTRFESLFRNYLRHKM